MEVLIVDDEQSNLSLFSYMLKAIPDVTPIEIFSSAKALDWCKCRDPDLVLLDYMMPEMDGLQFLQAFRLLPGKREIPVIMVTANIQTVVRNQALQMGVNDFLTKPVSIIELRARVMNLLALRKAQLQLACRADWLAEEVKKATKELVARERDVIHRLSLAAEHRDPETGAHLLRMASYSRLIAINLNLSEAEQNLI